MVGRGHAMTVPAIMTMTSTADLYLANALPNLGPDEAGAIERPIESAHRVSNDETVAKFNFPNTIISLRNFIDNRRIQMRAHERL